MSVTGSNTQTAPLLSVPNAPNNTPIPTRSSTPYPIPLSRNNLPNNTTYASSLENAVFNSLSSLNNLNINNLNPTQGRK